MSTLVVQPGSVAGELVVPGDKSIAHRALLLGGIGSGRTVVRGLPSGLDVASTARCLSGVGVGVTIDAGTATIEGTAPAEWAPPELPLDCGNSGTTMRLFAGLAARCPRPTTLDGDDSLRSRPMDRVCGPLRALGAECEARDGRYPPLHVRGGRLHGSEVSTGVASAQVKSLALLAAIGASGPSIVVEPAPTRDHTERMLLALGATVRASPAHDGGVRIDVEPFDVPAFELGVPGDPSSAAFAVTAALLGGSVRITGVELNPVRVRFLEAMKRMGAVVSWAPSEERMGEPVGEIEATSGPLRGATFAGIEIAALIDELPLLAVLATQATAKTVVRDAAELRVKESDRIAALADGLTALGGRVEALPDGFVVDGPTHLHGGTVDSWGDHRIALTLAVAAVACDGEVRITGWEAADVSWPGFDAALRSIGVACRVEES